MSKHGHDRGTQEVAQAITANFDMLYSNHFHGEFSFLSNKSKLQRVLRTYCKEHFPNGALLKTKRMDGETMELIRNGYLLAGLHRAMGTFRDAFGPFIVSSSSCQIEADLLVYANQAAGGLWDDQTCNDRQSLHYFVRDDQYISMEQCNRVYQECVDKFPLVYATMVTLLRSPEIDDWIHSAGGDAEDRVRFIRSDRLWNRYWVIQDLRTGDLERTLQTFDFLYRQDRRAEEEEDDEVTSEE